MNPELTIELLDNDQLEYLFNHAMCYWGFGKYTETKQVLLSLLAEAAVTKYPVEYAAYRDGQEWWKKII